MKFLEANIGGNLGDQGFDNGFLHKASKAKSMKENIY